MHIRVDAAGDGGGELRVVAIGELHLEFGVLFLELGKNALKDGQPCCPGSLANHEIVVAPDAGTLAAWLAAAELDDVALLIVGAAETDDVVVPWTVVAVVTAVVLTSADVATAVLTGPVVAPVVAAEVVATIAVAAPPQAASNAALSGAMTLRRRISRRA